MSGFTSAKQLLWLRCAGCESPEEATSDAVRRPPNERQRDLAAQLGVDVSGSATRYELALQLQQVLLLRAWVYSVWRSERGVEVAWHHELGFPDHVALTIAQEMAGVGFVETQGLIVPTDSREGDVWYRVGELARASAGYRFVLDRLRQPLLAELLATPQWTKPREDLDADERTPRRRRSRRQAARGGGCLGVVTIGVGVVVCGVWMFV